MITRRFVGTSTAPGSGSTSRRMENPATLATVSSPVRTTTIRGPDSASEAIVILAVSVVRPETSRSLTTIPSPKSTCVVPSRKPVSLPVISRLSCSPAWPTSGTTWVSVGSPGMRSATMTELSFPATSTPATRMTSSPGGKATSHSKASPSIVAGEVLQCRDRTPDRVSSTLPTTVSTGSTSGLPSAGAVTCTTGAVLSTLTRTEVADRFPARSTASPVTT